MLYGVRSCYEAVSIPECFTNKDIQFECMHIDVS